MKFNGIIKQVSAAAASGQIEFFKEPKSGRIFYNQRIYTRGP